jgi:hypothetical protein
MFASMVDITDTQAVAIRVWFRRLNSEIAQGHRERQQQACSLARYIHERKTS